MAYSHITKEQRFKIQSWLELLMPQNEIAARLGKDGSSVSREINRNTNSTGKYTARLADKVSRRRKIQGKKKKQKTGQGQKTAAGGVGAP